MSTTNIKSTNSRGWHSLCTTCDWAHIVNGFRESELIVICTCADPNLTVPFKVKECTSYLDRHRPDYKAMTDLAIRVEPSSSLKPVGFGAKVTAIDQVERQR